MSESVINSELLSFTRQLLDATHDEAGKAAFVPAQGDPSQGQGAPPGADPAAASGAPPGMPPDPGAAAGGPPGAPGDDPMAGGGGGMGPDQVKSMFHELMAQHGLTQGGAGGAGPEKEKKKVDVPTELYQIKKMLVFLTQSLGLTMPPDMLLGDPATDPHAAPGQAAQDPSSAAAAPGVPPMPQPTGAGPTPGAAAAGPAKAASVMDPVERVQRQALASGGSVRLETPAGKQVQKSSALLRVLRMAKSNG